MMNSNKQTRKENDNMTKEDKQLLLKDLCARLPYWVKVKVRYYYEYEDGSIKKYNEIKYFDAEILDLLISGDRSLDDIKPYLRPMSSMTEEEKKEFIEYAGYEIEESVNGRHYEYYLKDFCGTPNNPSVNADSVDWLNKKMFDFRGLIPKGLANEVTDYNNPYKD